MRSLILLATFVFLATALNAQMMRNQMVSIATTGEKSIFPIGCSNYNDVCLSYYKSGLQKDLEGNYRESLQDLNKAIELKSDYAPAIDLRGMVNLKLCRFSKAIRDFNRVLELVPGSAEYLNHRGIANYCIQCFDLALRDYSLAIEMDPQFAKAYYNRGILKLEISDNEGAAEDLEKAEMLNHPDAKRVLADFLER
jgi:tetratricopeptide (TPR) repeat protein